MVISVEDIRQTTGAETQVIRVSGLGEESGFLEARVGVMSSSDQEISETAGAETQVIRESYVSGLGGDSGCLCLPGSVSWSTVQVFRT